LTKAIIEQFIVPIYLATQLSSHVMKPTTPRWLCRKSRYWLWTQYPCARN